MLKKEIYALKSVSVLGKFGVRWCVSRGIIKGVEEPQAYNCLYLFKMCSLIFIKSSVWGKNEKREKIYKLNYTKNIFSI